MLCSKFNSDSQINQVPYGDHRHNSSTSRSHLISTLCSQSSKNSSKVAWNECHFSVIGNIADK